MKWKFGLTVFLALLAYAAYIHGYYLDNSSKLFAFDTLEIFPLWSFGTYIFVPAYFVISKVNSMIDLWKPWQIVGVWILIQIVYAFGLSWLCVEIVKKLKQFGANLNKR